MASDTLELALAASGCDTAKVLHRHRLLGGRHRCAIGSSADGAGASYVAGDLAGWLGDKGVADIRGAPNHPQTKGKIGRWRQTLKNRVPLENHFLRGELEPAVGAFVNHYNHRRHHESLGNLTPADVCFGRGQAVLDTREESKKQTIPNCRSRHHARAAQLAPDQPAPRDARSAQMPQKP